MTKYNSFIPNEINNWNVDFGCYNNIYKLLVVKNNNWSSQVEEHIIEDLSKVNELLHNLIIKYVN